MLSTALLFGNWDKISRNRYDSAHYKALLRKNGVKVISVKESIAEDSEGIFLEMRSRRPGGILFSRACRKGNERCERNALKVRIMIKRYYQNNEA